MYDCEKAQQLARLLLTINKETIEIITQQISNELILNGIHPVNREGLPLKKFVNKKIIDWAELNKTASGRGYYVYKVVNSDNLWRVRLEKYPSESSWQGGKMFEEDLKSKKDAEKIGEKWVETGIFPEKETK